MRFFSDSRIEPPKVLVVMPLYNARSYLRAAIESILNQTYPFFTLLIINDGSTDGSEQEAASFQDSRVMVWHQENQGPGASMNRALQYAIGENFHYLARMDSDDISMPLRLETQIHMLEEYPSVAACSSNCHYIEAESEEIIGTSTVSLSSDLICWEINHGLRGLVQSACVFRTGALAAINGYRSQFMLAEEVDVFLRLAEHRELRNCHEFLCKIRIRPNSLSTKDVRQNILYQFYAIDCAKKRREGKLEQDFSCFVKSMPLKTKFWVRREEYLLNLWREHLHSGSLSHLLIAALIDPKRVWIRGLRKLETYR